jgi:hypothetical protein
MDFFTQDAATRAEIARLEADIETLAARLENCRKVSLAARVAVGGGIALSLAGLVGAIYFDITVVLISITAVIGGLVLLGSNRTTAEQAAEAMAQAEAARAALIGSIRLRVVGGNDTLH